MEQYDPQTIEPKWQQIWERERAFHAPDPTPGATARNFYMLEMLPYPSGTLHMGHVLNYTLGDVLTHFHRRHGAVVMRPMGYDSFGLPAENAALRAGGHPKEITERNIAHIRTEMKRMGWAIDWARELSAHDPDYYRWTQWLFLRFFERGLAYRREAPVNWCPVDQTVLANEQVVDGRCERCGAEVEARRLDQWFFRITDYADALLRDHDLIDWPERTKAIQRNWIGRSEGAEVLFRIEELELDVPVFTTRPDTLFGATFFVVAPEHPLVAELVAGTPHEAEVLDYARRAAARSKEERETKEKDGVFTGRFATNPVNEARIPIWVADYVLMEYGTGAIMAVPAHDERDFAFAQRYDLPVRIVVVPASGPVDDDVAFVAHTEDERLVDSAQFSGLAAPQGAQAIVEWLESRSRARPAISYRLRDWSFSRQRYWGCPIPIVHCDRCGLVPVPDEQLPVVLPEVEDYRPRGKPPLASNEEWLLVDCPACGGPAQRDPDTMDTFVDSSWYFLRYCDPDNDRAPFERALADYWMPVDQYVGGIDHAIKHLLYARFFVKVLNELGLVGFREPFQRLFHQGWVRLGGTKMSKSRGNVAGPDQLVERHGADAVRLYILSVGPADQDMEWSEDGVEGWGRFLRRVWRIGHEVAERAPAEDGASSGGPLERAAHRAIAEATQDIEQFKLNTATAEVRKLVNEIAPDPGADGARFAMEIVLSLIQPYAPHIAEELWSLLGRERLWAEPWPEADPALLQRDTFELVVQVNGRVRDRLQVASDLLEDELIAAAKASPRVRAHVDGREIRQTIVVPQKLVNLVLA